MTDTVFIDTMQSATAVQITALKRAELWYLEQTTMTVRERATMVTGINLVLGRLFQLRKDEIQEAMEYAVQATLEQPEFSKDDFAPLMALAASFKDPAFQAMVRGIGTQAMNL